MNSRDLREVKQMIIQELRGGCLCGHFDNCSHGDIYPMRDRLLKRLKDRFGEPREYKVHPSVINFLKNR